MENKLTFFFLYLSEVIEVKYFGLRLNRLGGDDDNLSFASFRSCFQLDMAKSNGKSFVEKCEHIEKEDILDVQGNRLTHNNF